MNQLNQNSRYMRRESFLVVLDSRNANTYYNNSWNSHIRFDLKYPVRMPTDCLYATLCVYSFTCPISFYIINDTNNMLTISVNNGNAQHLFIPNGNYNVNTFITALLTILPSGFYVTLNSITNKLTLTHSTYDFTILAQSTIGPIMGFNSNENISSHLKTKELPYTVNFSGLNSFNIQINNIRTNNLDSFDDCSTSAIVATIPVNNASNGTIYYSKGNDFEFDVKDDIIDYLDVELLDDLDNYLDLNNQHWNLTLQFNYIRDVFDDSQKTFSNIVNFGQTINY